MDHECSAEPTKLQITDPKVVSNHIIISKYETKCFIRTIRV